MQVESFLELVGRHQGHTGKLLRLRAFLQEEAGRLRASDPGLSCRLLCQASGLTGDILRAQFERKEMAARACRLIERLPDLKERGALKLCYLSRVSARSASTALGCSVIEACRIRQRALMHLEGLGY